MNTARFDANVAISDVFQSRSLAGQSLAFIPASLYRPKALNIGMIVVLWAKFKLMEGGEAVSSVTKHKTSKSIVTFFLGVRYTKPVSKFNSKTTSEMLVASRI